MTQDISTLEFVAFDTETTGLNPASEAMVEIAAVRFNLKDGPLEYFQTLIDPERPISPFVTRIHGIDDAMVVGQPKTHQALPSFITFIGDAIPVAHHAPFDIGFIALHSMRLGLTLPSSTILDSCTFARRTFPDQPNHKLESLVKSFGITASTFHRALADAKSCMEVFRLTVAKSCGNDASWEKLLSAHGRVFRFGQDVSTPEPVILVATPWEPLLEAMELKKSLWIEYEGNFGPREITPLLVYAKGSRQYLEATCHLDGIRKNFRLDKIRKVFRPGLVPELG
jgi:DNA polymerase-3 subunit epsilon